MLFAEKQALNDFQTKAISLNNSIVDAIQKKDSNAICFNTLKFALFLSNNKLHANAQALVDTLAKSNLRINNISEQLYQYSLTLELSSSHKNLNFYRNYLTLAEEQRNSVHIYNAYNKIIEVYLDNNEIDKALIYLPSFQVWIKENNNSNYDTESLINLIRYNSSINAVTTSDSLYQLLETKTETTDLSADDYRYLIKLAELGNASEKILLKAHSFFQEENDLLFVAKIEKILAKNYLETNPIKAYRFLLSSIENTEKGQNLTTKKAKELDTALKQLQSDKEENHFSAQATLLVIAFLFLFIFLFKIKQTKKQFSSVEKSSEEAISKVEKLIFEADKKVEEKIEERKKTLNQELIDKEKLDKELLVALKNAEEANFVKNNFLSNMSHEIRTPLNGILGFSNLLETELAILDKKDLFEYASDIQQSGEKLLHLLNNIIDISRIQANDMEIAMTTCDIAQIINGIFEEFQNKATDKGLKLVKSVDIIEKVFVDKNIMYRIISEIIDNSIKYTEKGYIKISCANNLVKNIAELLITDTGQGIDPTFLEEIFHPYRQESLGYSRQYQGAGLGLPLAKSMAELMNCNFFIESKKTIGTTVHIEIPYSEGNTTPNQHSTNSDDLTAPSSDILSGLNILVIEDDKLNMNVLVKYLDKAKSVSKAFTAEEAIEIIRAKSSEKQFFDLIFSDINLPENWDGVKLKNYIRNEFIEYKNIPIIAQTAYGMLGDRERFINAGFDEYLPKPLIKEKVLIAIELVMNKFKSEKK